LLDACSIAPSQGAGGIEFRGNIVKIRAKLEQTVDESASPDKALGQILGPTLSKCAKIEYTN
jgi:hypothetical protein